MSARDWAGEYRALTDEIKRTATADSFDAQAIHKRNTYAMAQFPAVLDALDEAECEIERQRGDLVIERRRAEAAEAALDRVGELATDLENSPQVGYDSSEQWELDTRRVVARELRAALDGTS